MRILVIEDERKVAGFISRGLSEERYDVDVASDGQAGLTQALSGIYDAVVLDVMLPKMDGYTVLKSLRDAGSDVPVLMLTARGSIEDRVRGLDIGADDYLAKPFHLEELTARLRSILRRTSTEKSTKLTCGTLTLDLVSHFAYEGEREIELTTKEFTLIEFMMRNKGKSLSRTLIGQQVWKYDFDPESNIIDVYIKRLRSKLGIAGGMIEAIRRVGYRLKEPDNE